MTVQDHQPARSAFDSHGFRETVGKLVQQTKELYLSDDIPWVIGYSGGKDSTAILQLVWQALQELAAEKKAHKKVHVISTDTLVENPIVALWVTRSLKQMQAAVKEQGIPLEAHRLTPAVNDRFWVNLIGRGYPAPRYKFRWCTDRLKISPSNNFIKSVVQNNGEAILVLGTRKAESSTRSATMEVYENRADNTRRAAGLSVNKELDRVWVYTPIAEWSNDDVWQYLMQVKNPWGFKNQELLTMYQGATEDGECPLVVDKSTPSCGDSRFGCYVCTMVGEDKSMAAMIQNDAEKEWMLPLLKLRSEIDINDSDKSIKSKKIQADKDRRDFRRMNGSLTVHINEYGADLVRGPYRQKFREYMLRKVLEAQVEVKRMGPPEVKNIELLTIEDLEAIRKLWVSDKNEIEDNLPKIYEEVVQRPYPGAKRQAHPLLNYDVMAKLKNKCLDFQDNDGLKFEQLRELLTISDKNKNLIRRSKLFDQLESALDKAAFANIMEARTFALEKRKTDNQYKKEAKDITPEEKARLIWEIEKIESSLNDYKNMQLDQIDIQEI
ncbi:DNA phosphorothioation system sulfurtransferase DndC [Enterobacter hormaechei subsp. xiangfangensis]|uniref:DNA phosphorothioation system sulfurtransferase DndC n=1 Tax=Enterobacter hormaechei TaxID=158836 RepID=UPI001BDFA7F6|nr:DNA phosphorothioation system sulfurtransferase DndC [Enterobacter hormaechei]MBT2011242.1 DNA phosphorothioation system sulfurtransferase DndC [Enterobacter hormaechei subsp. xiangfangensis]ELD3425699.1 DNA phosphorothioation system sulfurtransferase DndC [Enterobacter hormaechei]MBT2019985.1 DNA phosphorothioation system sulfurtransferase DndC [Enterobacter hormaechei subsp. xiangfangensis]MBT2042752.1 DNA phosphorothioation system sulfurtransferase DndC [Enterobacter hormaechei subsp. xia